MGRFDDLKRLILRKRDFDTKYKLVKTIRREVESANREIDFNKSVSSVEVGFNGDIVVANIEASYPVAVMIKEALKDNKIVKHFDIRFKVDGTYPKEALKNVPSK